MITIAVIVLLLHSNIDNVRGQEDTPGQGSVRLFNKGKTGTNLTIGIVEVYYYGSWGTVCSPYNDFPIEVPDTVCRQLGYSGGDFSVFTSKSYGNPEGVAVISDVDCDSDSINILSCVYGTYTRVCDEFSNIAVLCDDDDPVEFSGMVRLTGQTEYAGKGLVEVYCNSQWGLICKDGFTQDDANTICRQLGYTNATHITAMSATSDQPIWFNTPGCNSSAQCIGSCTSCPSSSLSSCSAVVGVTCATLGYVPSSPWGKYESCLFTEDKTENHLVPVLVGTFAAIFVLLVFVVVISISACWYMGIGIGPAANRPKYLSI